MPNVWSVDDTGVGGSGEGMALNIKETLFNLFLAYHKGEIPMVEYMVRIRRLREIYKEEDHE